MNYYIPKIIKAAFNERPDNYSKRMAYLIAQDKKGNYPNEMSQMNWCEGISNNYNEGCEHKRKLLYGDDWKPLPIYEFNNNPVQGIGASKFIPAYKHEYGFRPAKMLIHNPRLGGLEFEVLMEDISAIMINDSIIKGILQGTYVYGWDNGGNIRLIDIDSDKYEKGKAFTELKSQKMFKKDMELGRAYADENNVEYVYLGDFKYYDDAKTAKQKPKKKVLYKDMTHGSFEFKNDTFFLRKKLHQSNEDVSLLRTEFFKNNRIGQFDKIIFKNITDEDVIEIKKENIRYVAKEDGTLYEVVCNYEKWGLRNWGHMCTYPKKKYVITTDGYSHNGIARKNESKSYSDRHFKGFQEWKFIDDFKKEFKIIIATYKEGKNINLSKINHY